MIVDYRLQELENFINKFLNPIHSKTDRLTERYRRFHCVVFYFEYATAMVRCQEEALLAKKPDADVCGSAIAAYIFMHDCFVLLESALSSFCNDKELAKKLKSQKSIHISVKERAEQIRHAIGAHPEGVKLKSDIATKRSMISTDGRIKIGKYMLSARVDLEDLRSYLEEVGRLLVLCAHSNVLNSN